LATKRSLFPDVFNPTVVKDRSRNALKAISLENEYDLLRQKPSRGYLKSLQDIAITSYDPDEVSYYKIINLKYNFLEQKYGLSGSGDFASARSEAYREYKQALRFEDEKAQVRSVEKLKKLGVTNKDLAQSMNAANPLSGLSSEKKTAFDSWLNGFQKAEVERAMNYYKETYRDSKQPKLSE